MSHITSFPTTLTTLKRPQNGWGLFVSLVKGEWQPGQSWTHARYRRKFMLRSLVMPFSTARLLNTLVTQPELSTLLTAQPGLPCRIHRPYLAAHLSRKEALNAICFHYKKMSETVPEVILNAHFTEQGFCLAELQGKNDEPYFIYASAVDMQGKEGEVTLNLRNQQQVVLAKITFTFCQYDGKNTLFVGGIQGAKASTPHEAIQTATKGCHGLFPKRVLLETLCTLAKNFAVQQIIAVGNDTHVYRSWRYDKKKKAVMRADYDSFWLSMGATLRPDNLFQLPEAIERKPLEEIASRKRAEYRRRYALLDTLMQSVERHFSAPDLSH